ncbi:MAG TPA: tRNA-(ms[2]io[6]A)-hydroxylase [Planctomycetota bacterium]|nr:tRNA-(ms[2]io[6]A)-hydroxylase [Planctomycetota bacterium]
MLGLRAPTNPGWAAAAAADPIRVLIDHAHCEKKAAVSALSLVSRYPARDALVERLVALAREELEHFGRVIEALRRRGASLAPDRPDPYVRALRDLVRPHEPERLLDELLVAALIEARSCERFSILSRAAPDAGLRELYSELLASEAGHYALFAELARGYFGKTAVEARLDALLDDEARIVRALPDDASMHG